MITRDLELEKAIKSDAVIIVDTCSVLEGSFQSFANRAAPLLSSTKKKLVVPKVVLHEILKNSKKPSLENWARIASRIINELYEQGLVLIAGDELEPGFGDVVFLSNVLKQFLSTDVVVITQDKKLTHDLLSFNDLQSVQSRHRICVYKLANHGFLELGTY